jgi:hypothetical protein
VVKFAAALTLLTLLVVNADSEPPQLARPAITTTTKTPER